MPSLHASIKMQDLTSLRNETDMNKIYLLYNPLAGNGKCREDIDILKNIHDEIEYVNMCNVDYINFFASTESNSTIIICGGDGTLNRFVNDTRYIDIKNPIFLYSVGTGNDFIRDLGYERAAKPDFEITVEFDQPRQLQIDGETVLGVKSYTVRAGLSVSESKKLDAVGI